MAPYDEVMAKAQADNVGGLQALQCLTVYICRVGTAHRFPLSGTDRAVPHGA